jgi:hypothetical protein
MKMVGRLQIKRGCAIINLLAHFYAGPIYALLLQIHQCKVIGSWKTYFECAEPKIESNKIKIHYPMF